jgi:class 3 adenylate cyclase/tetratricopeptide (TPR) repeat protein
MQCPQCQHANREQARFCEGCGTRLALQCAACGTELGPGARFCSECGTPVAAPTAALPAVAAPPAASRFTSPESYTPQHLAERIISSRGALEGERKQVTVLFADLKGSMELLADRDPEEARRILDPVLERMMDAVHRYEGTVNQVMGDGIMALFGAPLAHEDHAVRACYAALRMQAGLQEYADAVWRAQNVRLQIRVGLNSGEVVVRSIGSDLRMDYTAVGQTTHLAARMEQLATPGSILLAPDTLQLAEGYVQVKALGPVQVKGLSEPVEVYELVGAGTARSRLQAAAARGLTRFVGRDAELETLRRSLDQAGSGHGQIVALVGEPGVGKSRLVWEFGHSHRTQGWLVLEAGSFSYGKATSYLPVIALLKSYCGIEDRDDARRMREKLTGKLLTLDPALQPILPPLLALLDVPVDDAQWQALDPPQRRQRTLDALKRLLLRESQEQPLLLVFEDLHWIDAETQALLDSLVDSLPAARVLLLVNYRPEYEHAWHRKTYYQQLRLDPLPAESADALLGALLGEAAELAPLKRLLVARTEGNPFFVEESVRALIESGVLAGERGSYRVARPFESAQVPATVQAVLAARIDRLAPEDKRLLQAAAVIGKDVAYLLLLAIADLSEDALRQGLARLHAAEFLYETSLFPELAYTFKHALTHEVAYGSLLQDRRRALHGRVVAALDRLYPDRLTKHAERLAHHTLRGEIWDKAATYSQEAGKKTALRCAHREAVGYLEQAVEALNHLPETPTTRAQALDVRFALWSSLVSLGEGERLIGYLREAESLALAIDAPHQLARVSCYLTNHLWRTCDYRGAVQMGERALELATRAGDLGLQIQARHYVSMPLYTLGNYDQAVNLLRQNVAAIEPRRWHDRFGLHYLPGAGTRAWLTTCLVERGDFTEGVARTEEAFQIADLAQDPFSQILATTAAGYLYLMKGDFLEAVAALERGRCICEERDIPLLVPHVIWRLGYAYSLLGRHAEGIALLRQVATEEGDAYQCVSLTWLGHAYLLAGKAEEAAQSVARAVDMSRQTQQQGTEAYALWVAGDIVAQSDLSSAEQAQVHYGQALAAADRLGMRPLTAHCRLALGKLYHKTGRDDEARAELATAIELYSAMDMAFWLTRAETTRAHVGAGSD